MGSFLATGYLQKNQQWYKRWATGTQDPNVQGGGGLIVALWIQFNFWNQFNFVQLSQLQTLSTMTSVTFAKPGSRGWYFREWCYEIGLTQSSCWQPWSKSLICSKMNFSHWITSRLSHLLYTRCVCVRVCLCVKPASTFANMWEVTSDRNQNWTQLSHCVVGWNLP